MPITPSKLGRKALQYDSALDSSCYTKSVLSAHMRMTAFKHTALTQALGQGMDSHQC